MLLPFEIIASNDRMVSFEQRIKNEEEMVNFPP